MSPDTGSAASMLALPSGWGRRIALLALAPFFVLAGLNHFRDPAFYMPMMPPYLPAHAALVAISGVAEVAGGIGVLVPRFRSAAGWGLVALLLAILPANIHMALNPELFPDIAPTALYVRLPLQAVLVAWVYWATRPTPDA